MRILKTQSISAALISMGLLLSCATVARADFNPIALAPGTYNQGMVVPKTATTPLNSFINATMDGGTNKTGNCWYEQGYNTASPTHGIPPHNSTVTAPDGNHIFQMPPTYLTNCAIMVGHSAGSGTPLMPNGTLTLTTPAAFSAISLLNASGNGPVPVQIVVHHQDSTAETFLYSCLDWFNNANGVWDSMGRINAGGGGGFSNEGGKPAAELYNNDFTLSDSASPVVSIDFSYAGTNFANGRACIFAVSGSTDGTHFNPVAVSGYDFDCVIGVGETVNTGFPAGTITATMDAGTNKTGFTWYEQGYYTNDLSTGLPAGGSTISSVELPSAHYTLPTWSGNDAVMIDQVFSNANISFATPAAYGALSFLLASGNGDNVLPCVIQHADGTSETNAITSFDWFKTSVPWAFQSRGGGVNGANVGINDVPEQYVNPPFDPRAPVAFVRRLFDSVVMLNDTASAVTNIFIVRTNTTGGTRCAIFAVSGSPVGGTVAPFIPSQASQPGGAGLLSTPNGAIVKNWAGSNIVLSVTALGTGPFTYQWMAAPQGGGISAVFDYSTFTNLVDNGNNIVGSTTSSLMLTNANPLNSADYLVVIGNAAGSVTSAVCSVEVFATNIVDIPLPGDSITSFGGTEPAAETVSHAIDDLVGADPGKWLNFGGNNGQPFQGPIGFVVIPSQGASVISGLRLYSANDTTGRDPDDIMVEGSNDGATWNTIYSNALVGTLSMPYNRNSAASAPINPITQNVVQLIFPNATSYSQYRVTIANTMTPSLVNSMQINEIELLGTLSPAPPTLASAPQNETVYVGGSPTFSVTAVGPPPLSYQWYKNNVALDYGTNAVVTYTNAQLSDSGSTFKCVVTNAYGSISGSGSLTVIAVPNHPYPQAVMADSPVGLWRLDETAPGGSGDGLTAHDYAGGHNGIHHADQVDDGTGTIQPGFNPAEDPDTSSGFGGVVSLTQDSYVGNIPNISFAATNGSKAGFSVEAWVKGTGVQNSDAGILTKGFGGGGEQFNLDCGGNDPKHDFRFYMRDGTASVNAPVHAAVSTVADDGNWHHLVGVVNEVAGTVTLYVDGLPNGSVASIGSVGVMNSTFPVTIGSRLPAAGAPDYTLQWSGSIEDAAVYGYALTSTQVLAHYFAAQLPPHFSVIPTNLLAGEFSSPTLRSSAYGPGEITYQWYVSPDTITYTSVGGYATNANLTLTNVSSAQAGYYEVVATSQYGSTTSAPPAQLTISAGAPYIINDLPSSTFALAGSTLTLEADFGGAAPINYTWTKNGATVTNGGRISGATNNILVIAYATAADTGNYQVTADNPTNPPPTSSSVDAVTVVPDLSFRNTIGGWTTNGTGVDGPARLTSTNLQLTFNVGSTATAAWLNNPVNIDNWSASWNYIDWGDTNSGGSADGFTFMLQNDSRGTAALGGGGGSLGASGITPSSELEFNIYEPNTPGMTYEINGTIPAAGSAGFAPVVPVALTPLSHTYPMNPPDLIHMNVSYSISTGVLTVSLKDLTTGATFGTNYNVGDLSAVLGGHTAIMGFTGADGGVDSNQYISNFAFLPGLPPMMTSFTSPTNRNELTFSWPATAAGYTLQTTATLNPPTWVNATNAVLFNTNGTENVIVAPAGTNSFYRLVLPLQ